MGEPLYILEKSMKIACIVTEFPTISETFILNQITGLLDLGHDVQIFAIMRTGEKTLHADIINYQLMERVHYFPQIPPHKIYRVIKAAYLLLMNYHKNPRLIFRALNVFRFGKDALSLNLLYRALPFLQTHFDILQCHFGGNGNIGADIKRLGFSGKLVTMFHGIDLRLGMESEGRTYRKLFDRGDCFLVTSRYAYNCLVRFGADPKRILFHPVGIDVTKFLYNPRIRKDKSSIVVILTVARLVEEKGLDYGIRAIKELSMQNPLIQIEYRIIGGGKLENQLKTLVQTLHLEHIIHLLGPLNQEQVISELHRAHIFLLPSIDEAFGVVLLEAQAVGLPVIATDVGGVSQAMIHGKTGFLVPPNNVQALVEKLEYLIFHPNLWQIMGMNGRNFAQQHYDITRINDQLVSIYQNLLFEKTKPSV